jgi:hypothetical protein
MSRDEAAIEAEIQAKGKTAPRLTPQHIDEQISAEYYFNAYNAVEAQGMPATEALKVLTLCVLVLQNGYILTGESACASPRTTTKKSAARSPKTTPATKSGLWKAIS